MTAATAPSSIAAAEKFRVRTYVYGAPNRSAPQLEMYDGNLSRLLTTTVVGNDALGRPIFRGAIYDPQTLREVNGQFVADPFPGNIIPANRISPALEAHRRHCEAALRADQQCADGQQPVSDSEHA